MKFALPSSPLAPSRLHALLNSRYICERCLTRFFVPYRRCPACRQFGTIARLNENLRHSANSEEELRTLLSHGTHAGTPPRARLL